MSLDNFEVEKKLSQHIYKVRRIQDNKIYVLKKATIDDLSQKEIQNAINEVRFLASIRHPNVVSYKEAFYDSNSRSICIVTQYAEEGDLLNKIFQMTKKGDRFSEERVWEIFLQILKGLHAIHQLKITHRDLKSSNVMMGKNGIIKLGDFNVSIVLGKGMMCNNQTGTPYYASPEVFKDEPYNSKSDMWSLGCILYEILQFKPPFRASNLEGLRQKVQRGFYGKIDKNYSEQLSTILKLLLNTDPFERYSSRQLLQHPIIKDKLKHGKTVQSLETSQLLKTIRPSKNMIYLTDKLPKPNYVPVRYRSYFQLKDHDAPHKIYGSSMKQMPQMKNLSKSLNKSQFDPHHKSSHSPERNNRSNHFSNPEWLPKITNKRVKLY